MKRLCFWSATILLTSGSVATASSPLNFYAAAQEEPASSPSPSDIVPAEEMLPQAGPALSAPLAYPGPAAGGCASAGCGARPQCCERVPSHLDGVWDNYCNERSHTHPASKLISMLYIEHHHGCTSCPPTACDHGDCRFGLPTLHLPKLSGHGHLAPCTPAACAPCARKRGSLFSSRRHCKSRCVPCDNSFAAGPVDETSDISAPVHVAPDFDEQLLERPAEPIPPQPLPDMETTDEPAPEAQAAPDAQGWLPLPRLRWRPL